MKKIEFIGTSAVGKSTLFNELLKHRTTAELWKTPCEARIELAKKLPLKTNIISPSAISLLCLKLDLFSSKNSKIALSVLHKYEKDKAYKSISKYNDLIEVMLKSIVNDSMIEPYRKGKFIEFYMDLLLHDVLFLEDLGKDDLIIYEDGIIHNTQGLGNDEKIHFTIRKNPDILTEILPQGIIFCELDVEENYNRRKKRISSGKGTIFENHLDDEALMRLCERSIQAVNRKVAFLERYDIPVLRIDMKNPTSQNVGVIQQFISNF